MLSKRGFFLLGTIQRRPWLLLGPILIVALFFRYYQALERFEYGHDQDLYSWIIKDIVVNKHLRLIGQLTSTPGIFIGPFFYYLLIPFFLLSSMDPFSSIYLVFLVGAAGVLSYYFVFKNLFNQTTGLMASFLQAVLLFRVSHDRWIVPTIFTSLWEIWYFFAVMMLLRGNFKVLPLLGILIGLMGHISFTSAPILLAAATALFLAKKVPRTIDGVKFVIGLLLPSIPLIVFEIRHQFSQTKSLILSFTQDQLGGSGYAKLDHILAQVWGNWIAVLFSPFRHFFLPSASIFLLFIILVLVLLYKKIINLKIAAIWFIWIISTIGYFTFSTKIISEYYFSSLDTLFLAAVILVLPLIWQKSRLGKVILITILAFLFAWSVYFYIFSDAYYTHRSYLQKQAVVNYIADDARQNKFPCLTVSYITIPGENLGFRYLFYLKGLKVNQPNGIDPVYTIVLPAHLYPELVKFKYGSYAVIPPQDHFDLSKLEKDCQGRNDNLTDPMLNYTD